MKKLMALLMTVVMAFSVVGALADVDAANIVESPEFDVMTLGNYKYGEDYTSLYEKYGKDITIADVIEDEETEFREDGSIHWTIRKVNLFEVSVCTFPAYEATEVSARKADYEAIQKRKTEKWRAEMHAKLNKEEAE